MPSGVTWTVVNENIVLIEVVQCFGVIVQHFGLHFGDSPNLAEQADIVIGYRKLDRAWVRFGTEWMIGKVVRRPEYQLAFSK